MSSILTVAVFWENLCKIGIWSNVLQNHQQNTQGLEFSLSEVIKLVCPITWRVIGLFRFSYGVSFHELYFPKYLTKINATDLFTFSLIIYLNILYFYDCFYIANVYIFFFLFLVWLILPELGILCSHTHTSLHTYTYKKKTPVCSLNYYLFYYFFLLSLNFSVMSFLSF